MNTSLIGLKGPLAGKTIPLDGEETSIGRESSNQIALNDADVSRKHCVLRIQGEQVTLVDLGSLNGTMVNRIPVQERILQDQDQIEVGNSLFLLITPSSAKDAPPFVEQNPTMKDKTELRSSDSMYLHPERAAVAAQSQQNIGRNLEYLFQFTMKITAVESIQELGELLFRTIAASMPAKQGALLQEEPHQDLSIVFGWNRDSGETDDVMVSRTVMQQVLSSNTAILSSNASREESIPGSKSILAAGADSLLCVPVPCGEITEHVLYLTGPEGALQNDHLHLAAAFAFIAGSGLFSIQNKERLKNENRRLTDLAQGENRIIGETRAMKDVFQLIAKVSRSNTTVLVTGESGTGKELVAQAIHRNSDRAGNPLISINCAALTETLLESEIFGHEKGSFTGAVAQKKGKLEVAEGGTLFLDEVGEMSPALQAKMLRVIQERQYERVGGTRTLKADIRIIAATNKDLKEAIKTGAFRQDLYYRLNVVEIRLPPLRERREDIPLLVQYFVAKFSDRLKRKIRGLSSDARSLLLQYDWPGNIRELENVIERAAVLCNTEVITPEDLPETLTDGASASGIPLSKFQDVVTQTKKDLILHAIKESKGNITDAAKALGLHPNYLHRLITNLNLRSLMSGE